MYGGISLPEDIPLSPPLLLALAALSVFVILTGRPELSLGVFLALPAWTRPALIGPIAAFYPLAVVTILGAVVYMARRKVVPPVPGHDRWILPWMAVWWFWTLLLVWLFKPAGMMDRIIVPMVLYIFFPLPFLMLFGDQPRRINGFAVAYIITILIGAWLTLGLMSVTLGDLLADPMLDGLSSRGIQNFGMVNYHYFAYGTALSVIFAVVIFLQSNNILVRAAMLGLAGVAGYFLFQSGSRQSLGALAAVLVVMLVWGLRQGRSARARMIFIFFALAAVSLYIFQTAPHLIIRENEAGLGDAFNIVDSRGQLWEIAFGYFLQSPIWGHGYLYSVWAHNIFIGVLVDQGVVGMVFLLGFLTFLARRSLALGATETSQPQALWRMGLASIVLFGMIHAQASGSVASMWYLYWSGVLLWAVSRAPQARALHNELLARRRRIYPLRPGAQVQQPAAPTASSTATAG